MSGVSRGLPLLSGPPPPVPSNSVETACRKCNREFNVIFSRLKRCNHCGYAYCQSCTDYQALMPRENGYDAMSVCGFCIDYLTITAAGRAQLKSMPMNKLRNYINAYNIATERVVEKDDLIDAIVKARSPSGSLPPENEAHYRKYSVPNKISSRPRGFFSSGARHGQSSTSNTATPSPPPPPPPPPPPRQTRPEFARPDLTPDPPSPPPPHPYPHGYWSQPLPQEAPPPPPPRPSQHPYPPPPRPPPQQRYTPPPQPPPRPTSSYSYTSTRPPPSPFQASPNRSNRSTSGPAFTSAGQSPPQASRPPRPTTPQPTPQPTPPPSRPRATSAVPPPSLGQLLTMPDEAISSLSIGALKSILFTNHVTLTNVLEKDDLVRKVLSLVEDEKKERERQRQAEELEEMERIQREIDAMEGQDSSNWTGFDAPRNAEASMQDGRASGESSWGPSTTAESVSPAPPSPPPPPPKIKVTSHAERAGLCIICQDEEANIAIVDCGHLAMCRGCSELVMNSSRECPLCRTRIVTDARLLRIFKT